MYMGTLITASLLIVVVVVIAVPSPYNFFYVPVAFPFCIGPIAAARGRITPEYFALGTIVSFIFMGVGLVPYFMFSMPIAGIIDYIGFGNSLYPLFAATYIYFLVVAWLGGHVGGTVARH